ncbi:MazG nucleotide pyrophosphohydrolase domain-containing protein [Proteinivorax tanatarense]|uniref:MazG nucleotide pyrophosphohydrolase domain-containing protein n=1 Tax=Proteinivorax tanatarense TaxID=1260629 RepID=A0AAU7VLP1_9FIRM
MSEINKLLDVVEVLRSENGCPWDKKQTHNSLIDYVIEESYEVKDAILTDDMNKIEEELGDLLLQVVLHCQIAKENEEFDFNSCAKRIKEKLIFRHPHVFSNDNNKTISEQEVELIWKKQKQKENKKSVVLEGLPATLKVDKFFKTDFGKGKLEALKTLKLSDSVPINNIKDKKDLMNLTLIMIYLCKVNGHNFNHIIEETVKNLLSNQQKS